MEKLELFNISDSFINYLNQFDKTICYNKNELRPYVGPLFAYNGLKFYAPLSKNGSIIKHNGMPNNDNFIHYKIVDVNKETIGIIRFNNMIPVPDSELKKIDINSFSQSKKDLLNHDVDFIRSHSNTITSRALALFKIKCSKQRNNQGTKKYSKICCEFKLLATKANYFIQDKERFVAEIDISSDVSNIKHDDSANLLASVPPVRKVSVDFTKVPSNPEDKFLDIGDYAIEHKSETQLQIKSEHHRTKLNINSSKLKGFHM